MQVRTVRDLGALVRSARRAQGLTQTDLAERLRVSRDWIVRLEQGSPRLEAQKMLDALGVLGLTIEVSSAEPTQRSTPAPARERSATTGRFISGASAGRTPTGTTGRSSAGAPADPFGFLADRTC